MSEKGSQKVYDYRYAIDYALCHGPLDSINYVWIKDKRAFCGSIYAREDICINDDKLFGGDTAEGGINGVIECYMGDEHQVSSRDLARRMGFTSDDSDMQDYWGDAPAYPGIAHLFFRRAGADRGGFKWGTNNPYLSGIKVSVTRIPRQLSREFASIRPLDAVYAAGEVPDQQPTDTYGGGIAVPALHSELWREFPLSIAINNTAALGGLWIEIWTRDIPPVNLNASEKVGICDLESMLTGYASSDLVQKLDEAGEPVSISIGPDLDAIRAGLAYFEMESDGVLSFISNLGKFNKTITHAYYLRQFAANPDGSVGELLRTSAGMTVGTGHWTTPVHPDCRYYSIGMTNRATYLWHRSTPTKQHAKIKWPAMTYTHCSAEDDNVGELPDANPAHIVYELLLDSDEKQNTNAEDSIDRNQFMETAETLFNEGFGISIRQDNPTDRQSLLRSIAEHVRGAVFQHPSTGLWNFRLFRNDYILSETPLIDKHDAKIVRGSARAWSQCISEITVEYTDPNEEETASVTAHNDVGAAVTGNRTPEVRSYQFIRNRALAQVVADRDVVESSYPLWSGSIELSRKYWKMVPGDVFRLNYVDDDFQIQNMVLRVTNVIHGRVTERTITVEVVEDIFSVARTEYVPPQLPLYDIPLPRLNTIPQYIMPTSLPMGVVYRIGKEEALPGIQDHLRTAFLGMLDYRADTVSIYERFYAQGEQTLLGSLDFTPLTKIDFDLPQEVISRIPLATLSKAFPEGVSRGAMIVMCPDEPMPQPLGPSHPEVNLDARSEIMTVRKFDAETQSWLVDRGRFDTVPRHWPVGSLLWNGDAGFEQHTKQEVIPGWFTGFYPWFGRTFSGPLSTPIQAMWPMPTTRTARNKLPLRPGNVKVNNIGPGPYIIFDPDSEVTTLNITWSERNSDQDEFALWDGISVTPDEAVTYEVRIYDVNNYFNVLYFDEVDGTSTSISVTELAPTGEGILEVWAVAEDGETKSFMACQQHIRIDKVALDYEGWGYGWGQNWNGA